MNAPRIKNRPARRWLTLALIPLAGVMFVAPAPDASANFKKKSFKGHSSFRSSGRFNRNFNRSNFRFNRNFNRGFNNRRFNRSFNHSRFNRGFGHSGFGNRVVFVDRPVTFRNAELSDVGRSRVVDNRFTPRTDLGRFNDNPGGFDDVYDVPRLNATANDAWAMLEAGRFAQAQLAFGRLASASPQNAQPKVGFALASAALGEADRANRAFIRANDVDPNVWTSLGRRPAARAIARDMLSADNLDRFPEPVRIAFQRLAAAGTPRNADASPGEQTNTEARSEAAGENSEEPYGN
ncbi:MAG: hypothetical protein AAFX76_03085 [Planctomycetota bacterium]